jgi:hypothetical protein
METEKAAPSSSIQVSIRGSDIPGAITAVMIALLSVPIAVWLLSAQFDHTNIFFRGEWGLASYLNGTAWRPYAYRVLTPWLVHLAIALGLPHVPMVGLDPVVLKACSHIAAVPAATCKQVKGYGIVAVIFASGFLIAIYSAARQVIGSTFWGVATVGVAILLVNAAMLQESGHIYDFPSLFFATLLFTLAYRQRDILFTIALVLACLTKESLAVFIVAFAAIGYGARPLQEVIRNLSVQTVLFLSIYEFERILFASNEGAPMYHNIDKHFQYIRDKADISSVLSLLFFLILLLYHFPQKPFVLRRSMLCIPIVLALYVVGGNAGEFRIFFDIFPILLLPIMDSCHRLAMAADAGPGAEGRHHG